MTARGRAKSASVSGSRFLPTPYSRQSVEVKRKIQYFSYFSLLFLKKRQKMQEKNKKGIRGERKREKEERCDGMRLFVRPS